MVEVKKRRILGKPGEAEAPKAPEPAPVAVAPKPAPRPEPAAPRPVRSSPTDDITRRKEAEQAMRDSGTSPDQFFFDHRGGRGDPGGDLGDRLRPYRPTGDSDPFWATTAPPTLVIDEVERIWEAIDQRDDWAPLTAHVAAIRQLGQALTNIVKNAVEAVEEADASEGSITMTLSQAVDRVTIAVADTGVGLPLERDRIVEPYMTTRARGTGLGLAIVKKIMEDHGGRLSLDDRAEGPGAVATLSLPLLAMAAVEA